jgi:photosystem II stability/assembly factor-like uncharacterized protein
MNKAITIALAVTAGFGFAGCKKKGGGGGAWLVGENGLMANLRADGTMGPGYDLGGSDDLLGIGCRGDEVAFVVGEGGTALRTYDAGASWQAIDVGTTAALRDVAVAWELVYVAGDDGVRVSTDDGDRWTSLPGATQAFRTISTTDTGELALALAADGSVWRWDGATLAAVGAVPGAEAAALSHDGRFAAIAGDGGALAISDDGGASFTTIDAGTSADLLAVWAGAHGEVLAVGGNGTIVRVDGGVATASAPATATLRTVRLDGDDGFAAGDAGEVLATHDGGATWQRLDVAVGGAVYDLDDIE